MNSKEALRTVAFGSDLFANDLGHEAFNRLEADAQALWAVRVLDAAEEVGFQLEWIVNAGPSRALSITCPDMTKLAAFDGPSREASRISAATALVVLDTGLDPDLSPDSRAYAP